MGRVAIRRALLGVCVAGIAGMIATQVAGNQGASLTFGILTAFAAFGMILVTAVTNGGSALADDELGEAIEHRVQALVDGGADEALVRSLVGDAVRLGSRMGS